MLSVLRLANRILSSAVLITAFSLVVYLLRRNLRIGVARAFSLLLVFVMIVYLGDAATLGATQSDATPIWLKLQWFGIAFMPSAYLHFSDALLNATSSVSRWRRLAVWLSYLGSGVALLLVLFTPWIVREGAMANHALPRLEPGPLFWVFAAYFFAVVVAGAANINRARQRCMTSASRRRMGYLTVSFAAPALGVFPYMLLTTLPASLPEPALLTILLLGNVGVVLMVVVMAYAVAYFGAFTPDRVIKYSLIEYLLRGPFTASLVLVIMVTVPRIESILGISGDLFTLGASVTTIILMQMAINLARPFLNRLVYREDVEEIAWLQVLDQRLLTPSDLAQFLENVLSSLSELLRVRRAFVVTQRQGAFQVEACSGERRLADRFLGEHELDAVLHTCQQELEEGVHFHDLDGYVLRPLCTRNQDAVLGLLIVERWPGAPRIDEAVEKAAIDLIGQAQEALEDRHLQQGIFVALQQIMPDIERIQKQRQLTRYVSSLPQPAKPSPVNSPSFTTWVKDALSHYWGGPKLTRSPLLDLEIVAATSEQNDGDAVRALQRVLQGALESLRPPGKQSMTSAEWTLYNILDLKFRQGLKMSDIADRLAVSESDLYRKQRVAIEEMARTLANMEEHANV
ncbi:MAG: histidine kinase N-terminal 7TM domain-containing protein [Anaerolineae bacterium]